VSERVFNVLFLCTGNSARSILGEALLNHMGAGRFKAFSAGSHPKGEPNPYALAELRAGGIPTEGLRSKSWDEFAAPGTPVMDFVFTVCDQAAGETCPYWPGQPMTAHWGMPDPAAVEGSDEAKALAFRDTAITLKRRLELLMALPLASLDRMALLQQLREAGRR
jgi:arsenate reductase (thioredoxin)